MTPKTNSRTTLTIAEINSTKLFWKIDCYDLAIRFGSPDPGDPAITTRVLTVLMAEEG